MQNYLRLTCLLVLLAWNAPVFAAECITFEKWHPRADAITDSVWISDGNDPRYFTYTADRDDPFLFLSSVPVPAGRYTFTADFHVKDTPVPVVFTLDNAKMRDGSPLEVTISSGLSASVSTEGLELPTDASVTLRARAATTFRAEVSAAVGNARLCPIE